jgi:hypothetical protein
VLTEDVDVLTHRILTTSRPMLARRKTAARVDRAGPSSFDDDLLRTRNAPQAGRSNLA